MIFLLVEIESKSDAKVRSTGRAWVNTFDMKNAVSVADDYLSREGWELCNVIASEETEKSDYFRSCTGFESYVRAEEQGIAVLLTEEVCTV